MPLQAKVLLTQARIDEFYTGYNTIGYGNAYISFSGGKDSTVLLDIARKRYTDIPAVFSNTGLEYPEIRKFAMSHDNVEMVQPKMRFDEVISQYGYPLIGKEVAEAIYYARRLQPDKRERERERKSVRRRDELLGKIAYRPPKRTGGASRSAGNEWGASQGQRKEPSEPG